MSFLNEMEMKAHSFIFIITMSTAKANENQLDLISEAQMGEWILAAGGSNTPDALPPSKSCVTVTISDTGRLADCAINNFNYTTHDARIVSLVGFNEKKEREIYSVAPMHQWLDTKKAYRWLFDEERPPPEPISLNSLAKSTICWHPETHTFMPYTFTITAVSLDSMLRSPTMKPYDYLYLVGVNAGMPSSEIHVALLVKEKVTEFEVERMIGKIQNLFTKHNEFPPLTVKCAK